MDQSDQDRSAGCARNPGDLATEKRTRAGAGGRVGAEREESGLLPCRAAGAAAGTCRSGDRAGSGVEAGARQALPGAHRIAVGCVACRIVSTSSAPAAQGQIAYSPHLLRISHLRNYGVFGNRLI